VVAPAIPPDGRPLTAGGLHKVITTDHIPPPLNFDTAIVVVVVPPSGGSLEIGNNLLDPLPPWGVFVESVSLQ